MCGHLPRVRSIGFIGGNLHGTLELQMLGKGGTRAGHLGPQLFFSWVASVGLGCSQVAVLTVAVRAFLIGGSNNVSCNRTSL